MSIIQRRSRQGLKCDAAFSTTSNRPCKELHIYHKTIMQGISYPVLIKCCLKVLENENYIKQQHKIPGILLSLHSILLNGKHEDIFAKTMLINAYAKSANTHAALQIFESIPDIQKDAVSLINMLKCMIHNHCDINTIINLYQQFEHLADDRSYLLLIKAYLHNKQFLSGKHLIESKQLMDDSHSIELKSTLINFYGHFGDIPTAYKIFNGITDKHKNHVILNCMLQVLIQNDLSADAICLHQQYHSLQDDVSDLLALKACANTNNIQYGNQIIGKALKTSTSHNIQFKNTLIGFYSCTGELDKSWTVFESIPDRQKDIICITAMMKCFMDHRRYNEVLSVYHKFKHKTVKHRNDSLFVLALRACISDNRLEVGKQLIADKLVQSGVSVKTLSAEIQNALMSFYAHFGDIKEAQDIYDGIANKTTFTLNNMMKIWIHAEQHLLALAEYDKFKDSFADNVSRLLAIKACTAVNDTHRGHQIITDSQIDEWCTNHDASIALKSTLIDFYSACGDTERALTIFDSIPDSRKDVICIGSMIKALVINQQNKEALQLYHTFNERKLCDDISHLYAITACMNLADVYEGESIIHSVGDITTHSKELRHAVIQFHGQFNRTSEARAVFNGISDKDAVSVNSMMQALINNHSNQAALEIFAQFELLIDDISRLLALKACINSDDFEAGQCIIDKQQITNSKNTKLRNVVLEFYGHFGQLARAQSLFDAIDPSDMDGVTLNCMLNAYIKNDCADDAICVYEQYDLERLTNNVSHLLYLKACTKTNEFEKGHQLITYLQLNDLHDIELLNTIIDYYGHFGDVSQALHIFDCMRESAQINIVSVNAMMNVYNENKFYSQCIQLYQDIPILSDGLQRNSITFVIALKACTDCACIDIGRLIHQHIRECGQCMENDLSIQINLINMYANCGSTQEAEEIFGAIKLNESDKYCHEIKLWNAMIHAYARNGNAEQVETLYELLKCARIQKNMFPEMNTKTFAMVITAFGHNGDVEKAHNVWNQDIHDEDTKYDCFVVTALVDCLSRSGKLSDAYQLVSDYENRRTDGDTKVMWMALLNGCVKHRDPAMSNTVFTEFKRRFHDNAEYMSTAAVLMSSLQRV